MKIHHNKQKNGIEIQFPQKPSDGILDNIKKLGFRWSKFGKFWYAPYSDLLIKKVEALSDTPDYNTANSSDNAIKKQYSSAKGSRIRIPLSQHITLLTFLIKLYEDKGIYIFEGDNRYHIYEEYTPEAFIDENGGIAIFRIVDCVLDDYKSNIEKKRIMAVYVTKSGSFDIWEKKTAGQLIPITIPTTIDVPPDRRGRYTKKMTIPRLREECMLGKMEAYQYREFNGMIDGYDYMDRDFKIVNQFPARLQTYDKLREWNDEIMYLDNWKYRYRSDIDSKPAPARINVKLNLPGVNKEEEKSKKLQRSPEKFFALAASAEKKAEDLENSLSNKLTNTHKRMGEWGRMNSRKEKYEAIAQLATLLGKAWQNDTVPEDIKKIEPSLKYFDYVNKSFILGIAQDLGGSVVENTDSKRKKEIRELENSLKFQKIPGFFPTPTPVVLKMIDYAEIVPTESTILEPSAGIGSIAEVVQEKYPNNSLDVAERSSTMRSILEKKGMNVVADDTYDIKGKYDVILMNPPFENGQDIAHVQFCYENLLAPGGRLVAIMSEGSFSRSGKKDKDFQHWYIDYLQAEEKLNNKTFTGKDAFRSTGTSSRLIVLAKGKQHIAQPKKTSDQYPEIATIARRALLEAVRKEIAGKLKANILTQEYNNNLDLIKKMKEEAFYLLGNKKGAGGLQTNADLKRMEALTKLIQRNETIKDILHKNQ